VQYKLDKIPRVLPRLFTAALKTTNRRRRLTTLCPPKKRSHFYFLNNSVKNEPILIIFGVLNPEGT